MKNFIFATILLIALSTGAFFMLCKLADRIIEKEDKISVSMIRVDKVMQEYYQRPVNFEALNAMPVDELDKLIKEAGY